MFKKTDLKKSIIIESYTPEIDCHPKHIVVLAGGISTEREISMLSAMQTLLSLKELQYKFTAIDMGRDIANILSELKPDLVLNCLHGSYGEDGSLPGLLEIMSIPYTHSGVAASAIAMDKIKSKALFRYYGIMCAEDKVIHKNEGYQTDPMPRPYVIKPISEGSSIGVHVIFPEDDFNFSDYQFDYGDQVMIERYIPGKEIQVAILGNKAIGALEIVPKGRFYDYEAKYSTGIMAATHLYPATISQEELKKVLNLAQKAHEALGCRSVSRVEFRYHLEEKEFYLLEVNTHPGMTSSSIVPEIAQHCGISFTQFIEYMIKESEKEHHEA